MAKLMLENNRQVMEMVTKTIIGIQHPNTLAQPASKALSPAGGSSSQGQYTSQSRAGTTLSSASDNIPKAPSWTTCYNCGVRGHY